MHHTKYSPKSRTRQRNYTKRRSFQPKESIMELIQMDDSAKQFDRVFNYECCYTQTYERN